VGVVLAVATSSAAQEALTAKVEPSGTVRVLAGEGELAMIELNAHGTGWKHVPQAEAMAQVSDLPDGAGKRITGTLQIPDTAGGPLRFTQTVKPIPQGLQLEYDVSVVRTVRLNGLQVSVCLPTARFAGKELLIGRPDREPEMGSFPREPGEQTFQVWAGEGERIEAARGTPEAVAARLRAVTDIIVQDLRRWEHETFEIRFPAIMEDGGREVAEGDRFHLDFIVTFAAPVKLASQ
jgi:hypothetical protein